MRVKTLAVLLTSCLFSVVALPAQAGKTKATKSTNAPGTKPKRKPIAVSFRNGVLGYNGVLDIEIWSAIPTTSMADEERITVDLNNGGGESQTLVQFRNIIGNGKRQIPRGSRILKAAFKVWAFDPGSTVYCHRVLVPWDNKATWKSLCAGLSADGVEARRGRDGFTFANIVMDKQVVAFDARDTVQSWANGSPNCGWFFRSTGGNGWDFYSSEWRDPDSRPLLEVTYLPPLRSSEKAIPAKAIPAKAGPAKATPANAAGSRPNTTKPGSKQTRSTSENTTPSTRNGQANDTKSKPQPRAKAEPKLNTNQ